LIWNSAPSQNQKGLFGAGSLFLQLACLAHAQRQEPCGEAGSLIVAAAWFAGVLPVALPSGANASPRTISSASGLLSLDRLSLSASEKPEHLGDRLWPNQKRK
jgi:hypothetical protein